MEKERYTDFIDPTVEIVSKVNEHDIMCSLEEYGRTCYKSESRIGDSTARTFVRSLIKRGHESVLEHVSVTVRIVCDRGVTHELVRHRLASYSQESTRYCDYATGNIVYITPEQYLSPEQFSAWSLAMTNASYSYRRLRELGCSPQMARSVLPNSLKTEIVTTMNLREWRYVIRLRTSAAAHPQMRQVMLMILEEFRKELPIIFEDI